MAKKAAHWTEKQRLGLRIDPKVIFRLNDFVHAARQAARKNGLPVPSQEEFIEDALVWYMNNNPLSGAK